jgi:hypothetical protein
MAGPYSQNTELLWQAGAQLMPNLVVPITNLTIAVPTRISSEGRGERKTLRQQPPRWSARCELRGGCDAPRRRHHLPPDRDSRIDRDHLLPFVDRPRSKSIWMKLAYTTMPLWWQWRRIHRASSTGSHGRRNGTTQSDRSRSSTRLIMPTFAVNLRVGMQRSRTASLPISCRPCRHVS